VSRLVGYVIYATVCVAMFWMDLIDEGSGKAMPRTARIYFDVAWTALYRAKGALRGWLRGSAQ